MKRIISLLICVLMFFGCSANAFAGKFSDIEETQATTPSIDSGTPQYTDINNISITFYVLNGRAYATYAVSSQKNGIIVSVKFEKRTLGFIWVDVSDEKQEKI